MSVLLVEEYRGGLVECEYWGHICGVDETGNIRFWAGNPRHVAYMRSTAKPIQAIPAFKCRVNERFGLDDKQMTIMTASHRGEPFHIRALESMLDKIGVKEDDLICHPAYPSHKSARDELIAGGKPERRLYHNCSGKHLGIIAYCKCQGYPTTGYEDPQHPAQRDIRNTLAFLSETPSGQIHTGIDGCGLPVFALPLHSLALAYLKLACPDLIADPETRDAVERMTLLMNANYEMVSGTHTICSTLLTDGNIVAKGGAQGVYCFGLREERLAFALKVIDGSQAKWPLIVASILEQIGYKRRDTIERLYTLSPVRLTNGNGTPVGEMKAVFRLQTDHSR